MNVQSNTEAVLYSPEFIEGISRIGFETLKTWLENNNTRVEVIDLLEDIWMLKTYVKDIEKGELQITGAEDLAEIIPGMTKRIVELGGSF
jgi:hypothetical protein